MTSVTRIGEVEAAIWLVDGRPEIRLDGFRYLLDYLADRLGDAPLIRVPAAARGYGPKSPIIILAADVPAAPAETGGANLSVEAGRVVPP